MVSEIVTKRRWVSFTLKKDEFNFSCVLSDLSDGAKFEMFEMRISVYNLY